MATIPYILPLRLNLNANGTGTLPFTSPRNESYKFTHIRVASTGAWQVNSIRTSTGLQYTNASPQAPLEGTLFQNTNTPNIGMGEIPIGLDVGGGETLNLDIQDTSGAANLVRVYLIGERTMG